MTEKDYDFKAIRVKAHTWERFTKQRKAAGLTGTEYTQYLLNLGTAYPPTQDYAELLQKPQINK